MRSDRQRTQLAEVGNSFQYLANLPTFGDRHSAQCRFENHVTQEAPRVLDPFVARRVRLKKLGLGQQRLLPALPKNLFQRVAHASSVPQTPVREPHPACGLHLALVSFKLSS